MSRARVAALLGGLLVAGAAVAWSTRPGPDVAGDVVPLGAPVGALELAALDGTPFRPADHGQHAATVIWFWSVLCPCVEECEGRLRELAARYAPRGVRLLVVHPIDSDTAADIEAKRARLASPYVVHRDPGGRLTRRLGITNSGSAVVLDRQGRLRFRGALDDDLYDPRIPYLANALDALLAGLPVPLAESSPTYGCLYRR